MKFKILFSFIALIANCTSLNGDLQHSLEFFEENTILSLKNAALVTFDKSFYEATYTDIKNEIDLIKVEGNIAVSDTATAVTISGDYAYHFNINCLNGICQLTVKEDLPEDLLTSTRQIVIGLEASNEENTERSIALVIIHLPLENIKPAPKFSQIYYVYDYQINGNIASLISIGGPITITSDNNTLVSITLSDYQENFAITYNVDTDLWSIAINKSLDESTLYDNAELIISLTSVLEDSDQGTATLIIKLPEKGAANVTFDKTFYEAIYTTIENEIDLITLNEPITISDKDANVSLSGDYAGHFVVNCQTASCTYCQTGNCLLSLKEDLAEDTLRADKEIIIGLEASNDKNTEHSIALIIIHLPLDNIKPAPQFGQTYYIYEYQIVDDVPSLVADGNPITVTSDNIALVNITLSDYQDNFAVTYNSKTDQWSIVINQPLNESALHENTQLLISLKSVTNDSYQDTATLLIKLPGKVASDVTFDKTFYEAIYTSINDETDMITVNNIITISDKNANVTLSGDYAYHFNINCQTGNCLLTVKEDLPQKTLTTFKQTIIGIEASNDKNTESSIALVIIHLPLDNIKPAPKFSQTYYIYEYQIVDDVASLVADRNPINVTSDNITSVTITLSDYQDNFAVTYDSRTDQWNIVIKTDLEDAILKKNTELVVELTGELVDSEKGTATLLIKLPEKKSPNVTFGIPFYTATYNVIAGGPHSVITKEVITISDTDVTVTLTGDYASHFGINCASDTLTCQLIVDDNLSEYVLSSVKQIILGLEVIKEDIVEPVTTFVLITLPLGDIKPGPKFSQTYYIYEYQIVDEEPSLIPDGNPFAIASDNNTLTQVTLSDYQDNFGVTYDPDSDQWAIVITAALDDTLLNENTELVTSLIGVLDDSEGSTATLLIRLPEKTFYSRYMKQVAPVDTTI